MYKRKKKNPTLFMSAGINLRISRIKVKESSSFPILRDQGKPQENKRQKKSEII